MGIIFEFSITILLTFLIILAVWAIYGRLVTPVKSGKGERLYLVVCASGSTPDLFRTAKGIRWLSRNGRLSSDLVILDAGLDAESRKMAEIIARDCGEIRLCELGELDTVLAGERREECLKRNTAQ